ncbi:hypothetical protein AUP40_00700 [Thalassospira xiamenensis]|uniref:Uncharacterized protein n=1 Tax=Thalassospira xiamenensis TaxID=220697 RepID=A0ABR5Y3J4_9PROT|nr:hypothetical protein AUP40_00700 [Thalassospira xiamenensis]
MSGIILTQFLWKFAIGFRSLWTSIIGKAMQNKVKADFIVKNSGFRFVREFSLPYFPCSMESVLTVRA